MELTTKLWGKKFTFCEMLQWCIFVDIFNNVSYWTKVNKLAENMASLSNVYFASVFSSVSFFGTLRHWILKWNIRCQGFKENCRETEKKQAPRWIACLISNCLSNVLYLLIFSEVVIFYFLGLLKILTTAIIALQINDVRQSSKINFCLSLMVINI